MAVQIPAEILAAAKAADSDYRIQIVLMALAVNVPDFKDYALGAANIREKLAHGATLWDALAPWTAKRTEICALVRKIQTEGIEGQGADMTKLLAAGLIIWLLLSRRR